MHYTIDFETRSHVDIRKAGAARYAEDPTTEIICLAYKHSDWEEAKLWVPGMPDPEDLIKHVIDMGEVSAFNAMFERHVWNQKLVPLGWPSLRIVQQYDPQAVCLYRAMPGSLDGASIALGLKNQKDKRGKHLIQRLSKPRKPSMKDKREYFDDIDDYEEFYDYCIADVEAEAELATRVGKLPAPERAIWELDQNINDRGIKYDRRAADLAMRMLDTAEIRLLDRFEEIVRGGGFYKPTQNAKFLEWLQRHGQEGMTDLTEDTIDHTLKRESLHDYVREALEIRQLLARSSTKKLASMKAVASPYDDRLRGLLQYHGAGPGRWAGRLVQPQNFPRPVDTKADPVKILETVYSADGHLDAFEATWGPVHPRIADVLRSFLIADRGRVFCAADFSSIEARVLMWLAGQEDAVQVLASGANLYIDLAEKIFGRKINKHDDLAEYTVGKAGILGLGYQMSGSKLYSSTEMDYDGWTPELAEEVKTTYREQYSMVPRLWRHLEDAAIQAVNNPGRTYGYGKIEFEMRSHWLTARLPNGKRLWYFNPKVRETTMPWHTPEKPAFGLKLGYWAYKFGQWRQVDTYGGKLVENVTQATARELMAAAMPKAEAAGYPIVLTVHDELVTEPFDARADHKVLEEIMCDNPPWAAGLPVAAEGWTAERYRK